MTKGMMLSVDLADKSVQAAIAAIEIYNKPNFSFREEAFALLMSNAWELLLKAKWIQDHGESIESIHEMVARPDGSKVPKKNRSGNPLSHSASYLAAKLKEDKDSGLQQACHDNFIALLEIRDNAAHFLNKDLYLGRRILEIGTASLRNYLCLASEWFQLDLSSYNFFLMPISFYHGFEAVEPTTRVHYPEQIQKLLAYLDQLESQPIEEGAKQHVALRLETKLVRANEATSLAFRWTDDPCAPAITVREEDVMKNFPMTYRELANALKRRYENFLENRAFHKVRQSIEKESKFVMLRLLHPGNPKSSRQRFYNSNILQEFDKHYGRKKKT
jgi:hypothetical protein